MAVAITNEKGHGHHWWTKVTHQLWSALNYCARGIYQTVQMVIIAVVKPLRLSSIKLETRFDDNGDDLTNVGRCQNAEADQNRRG